MVIEVFEKTVGKENSFTWKTYNNLSGCYFKFGDFSKAKQSIIKCNNICNFLIIIAKDLFLAKFPTLPFPYNTNFNNIMNMELFNSEKFEFATHESYLAFSDRGFEVQSPIT